MNGIDLAKWPFRSTVAISICMSALHGLLQMRWASLRYRTFGPRPGSAQMFIGIEILLLMLILGVGFIQLGDKQRIGPKVPYILGISLAIGTWIAVSFLLS